MKYHPLIFKLLLYQMFFVFHCILLMSNACQIEKCNFFNVMHIFCANMLIIGISYQSLVFAIKGLHILKKYIQH